MSVSDDTLWTCGLCGKELDADKECPSIQRSREFANTLHAENKRLHAVAEAAAYCMLSGFCIDAEDELENAMSELDKHDSPQRVFGRRLRATRKLRRKNMGELAEATDESVIRVSDIERGIGEPAHQDFVAKATAFLRVATGFLEER
jgi:hypothetical protein